MNTSRLHAIPAPARLLLLLLLAVAVTAVAMVAARHGTAAPHSSAYYLYGARTGAHTAIFGD